MKLHTTKEGDQFLIDHIQSTTSWSQRNHRRIHLSFTTLSMAALILGIFLMLLCL